jgi:YHS domain-containing protein
MRVLLYLIVGVVILTLLRSVLEAVGKAFAGGTSSSPTASSTGSSPRSSPRSSPHGEPQMLKKDPVCGTFVSEATAVQKTKGGQTYYFCSAACRDKF